MPFGRAASGRLFPAALGVTGAWSSSGGTLDDCVRAGRAGRSGRALGLAGVGGGAGRGREVAAGAEPFVACSYDGGVCRPTWFNFKAAILCAIDCGASAIVENRSRYCEALGR